jgi:hypothetical protein
MSFRRDVFRAVGGFRTGIGRVGTLPVGCEETEFSIRVRQRIAGAVMVLEPRARVRHHVPPERATPRYFLSRCYAEGLSKALVTKHGGVADGLDSERRYASRTLPIGIALALRDAILRREPGGAVRAAAILAGLAVTTAGFIIGVVRGLKGDLSVEASQETGL